MIKQVGRMPPELSSKLQYRDYTTNTTEGESSRQVFSKQSERRPVQSSLGTATGSRQGPRGLSIDQGSSLILRNTYGPIPPSRGKRDIHPTATFTVPDMIAQALKNRDQPDIYTDIVRAHNQNSSRSPPIRQDESGD